MNLHQVPKMTCLQLVQSCVSQMFKTTCLRLRPPQKLLKISSAIPIREHLPRRRRFTSLPLTRPTIPSFSRAFSTAPHRCKTENQTHSWHSRRPIFRENIYTIPNMLTVSRVFVCPVLGWSILNDNFYFATGLLVYAGLTDLVCPRCLAVYVVAHVLSSL